MISLSLRFPTCKIRVRTIPTSVDAQEDLTLAKYPGFPFPDTHLGGTEGNQLLTITQQTNKENRLTFHSSTHWNLLR